MAVELALEQAEDHHDHVGIWGAMVCRLAREIGAEPRFLSPALAQAFLQTERPLLTIEISRDVRSFHLFLPKATLFSEEGPEIRMRWRCVWPTLLLDGRRLLTAGSLGQGPAAGAHRLQRRPLGLGRRWGEGQGGADGAAGGAAPRPRAGERRGGAFGIKRQGIRGRLGLWGQRGDSAPAGVAADGVGGAGAGWWGKRRVTSLERDRSEHAVLPG